MAGSSVWTQEIGCECFCLRELFLHYIRHNVVVVWVFGIHLERRLPFPQDRVQDWVPNVNAKKSEAPESYYDGDYFGDGACEEKSAHTQLGHPSNLGYFCGIGSGEKEHNNVEQFRKSGMFGNFEQGVRGIFILGGFSRHPELSLYEDIWGNSEKSGQRCYIRGNCVPVNPRRKSFRSATAVQRQKCQSKDRHLTLNLHGIEKHPTTKQIMRTKKHNENNRADSKFQA